MKKMLVLLVVVMAALSAHAQEMYLGGGISLWRNTDLDKTSFSITPDVGYELSEQWALGIELAYACLLYTSASASPPLFPGPAKTTMRCDLSHRLVIASVSMPAAFSIRLMERIPSCSMVYASASFCCLQFRIFITF